MIKIYQHITHQLKRQALLKSVSNIFIMLLYLTGCSQVKSIDSINTQYHTDSLVVIYSPKKQQGQIKVKLINPCQPGILPYDAAFTAIECTSTSENGKVISINFIDPASQMELIYFNKSEIWETTYLNKAAVFIPFSYCGSFDNDLKYSSFIIYNNNAYLAHLYFSCGTGEKAACEFKRIEIVKGKNLPKELLDHLISEMKSKYNSQEKFPG